MEVVCFKLPDEELRALDERARALRLTRSDIIRWLLRDFLSRPSLELVYEGRNVRVYVPDRLKWRAWSLSREARRDG